MGDFFAFRRMLTPLLIQVVFWVGVLGSIALGVAILFDQVPFQPQSSYPTPIGQVTISNPDTVKAIVGLVLCLGGPLVIRLVCEMIILPYRINGTLTDIRNSLRDGRTLDRDEEPVAPAPPATHAARPAARR